MEGTERRSRRTVAFMAVEVPDCRLDYYDRRCPNRHTGEAWGGAGHTYVTQRPTGNILNFLLSKMHIESI